MDKFRTVIFCGQRSKFALAHIEPLLKSEFHLIWCVFLTDRACDRILAKLLGKPGRPYASLKVKLKRIARRFVPYPAVALFKKEEARVIDYKNLLKKHKVPVSYEDDVNTKEFIQRIRALKPDVFISLAFPQIFKKELIAVPPRGMINFHPSLLPKYRGTHSQFWVLAAGETESGVTAHYIDEGVDTGDIIAQIRFSIKGYTYTDLRNRNHKEVPELVRQVQVFFADGKTKAKPQDHARATYIPIDRERDHKILWASSGVKQIFNLIRTEFAFCMFRGKKITLLNGALCADIANAKDGTPAEAEPGTIAGFTDEGMIVQAKDGLIRIHEVVLDKKRMPARRFAEKYKVKPGEQFE